MRTGEQAGTETLNLPGQVFGASQQMARVAFHVPWAKKTYRMHLDCPAIAAVIHPGQFFMVKIPGMTDPLLGRPFAVLDVGKDAEGEPRFVDFGYVVVGKMTSRLAELVVGDQVEVWGPLGNGFPVAPAGRTVCVAGGIGQTPFMAVAKEALGSGHYGREVPPAMRQITLCYGVRSTEYLAGLTDFEGAGVELKVATDDGSYGHRGFVTDLLKAELAKGDVAAVYCCGPEPMMKAVSKVMASTSVPCWVSLESPMACGFGACFSCVTKVIQEDGTWDYRRVCVEGPVFRSCEIEWD
jgi:dihydroorotate dehydrogenase electron transfer subunit